ncbi:hypothetical protein ACVNS2_21375 [Paenibacillus caseinilyticus]|uniref:Uncharacterized protein n=1 Tax=Paenibacillus mucilaginosus K02 TaxID=997761 RepID=I0BLG8_9BACL|nr:hypothetical protein [Paenibacillus mucilaginosus]AFH63215.1 hypothetical protein B2K_21340 [Paenibacillus mucilaginosus K02]AFK65248.1 hypothetical protein [Paenibacillus mucilaginosus K02]
MKLSKKSLTVLSFTLGASVFVSTAFADALLGSGYDRLKDSVKLTASQMEQGLGSYTMEAMVSLEDNGKPLLQASNTTKVNTSTQAEERTSVNQQSNGETTSSYTYTDPKMTVHKSSSEEKYFVTEFQQEQKDRNVFTSPFKEKGAPEIEKIVDAVVGNLKDYVQAEEKADGGRVYSGSLSEAQVPAVVNAVSSFGIKRMIESERRSQEDSNLPEIESDIYVKKIVGTAEETKTGLLQSLTGDITLTGKDKNGTQHDLTMNIVFKLSDVGTTKITLPDLTGANVEKVTDHGNGFSAKYVGTYKNNVILEKDGKLVKIGERTLEILSVDKDKVTGRYTETVKPGFEAEFGEKYNFTFEYDPNQSKPFSTFTYTNAKGEQEQGQLHPGGMGSLYLELDIEVIDEHSIRSNGARPFFDGQFHRVFEE